MIARLFLDAAEFGVSDPREQAGAGLLELARAGSIEIFCRACQSMIEGDGPTALFGLRVLFEARNGDGVAQVFRAKLNRLAEHEDGCVAVLAAILSGIWGGDASVSETEPPAIYMLQLPQLDDAKGRTLRDAESLGPVIDDPGAWTEGFENWIENLSRYSGAPVPNIRYRVAQLITGWGGASRYGAKATEELENRVNPLGLLLPFVRPHIGVCIRALHVVVGELWRAGTLSQAEFDLLLHQLAGGPLLPPRTAASARPTDNDWPTLPKERWKARADDWLRAEGMKRSVSSDRVVGEWARFVMLESGSLYCEDMLVTPGMPIGDKDELDAAIRELPKAYWACGQITLGSNAGGPSLALRNLRIAFVGNGSEVLMFDPILARRLGWRQSGEDPFSFWSEDDVLMATTRIWRDGWQQERRREARWAEGQRVELTEAGKAQIEGRVELPEARIMRWRTLSPRHSKEQGASSWRSDAPPLIH